MSPLALLLVAFALAPSDPEAIEVLLDLSRDDAGRPTLSIQVELPAGEHDLTAVRVRRPADGAGDLQLVGARDLEGRALQVDPGGVDRWLVHHRMGERFRVEARLDAIEPRVRALSESSDQVLFHERALFAAADWLLPLPEEIDWSLVRPVRIEWAGHDLLGWEAASSLGGGRGPLEARMNLPELRDCLLMAGEFERFDYEIPGGALLVATVGEAWGSDRIEFAELARDSVAYARSYFEDTADPFHLVSLVPRRIESVEGRSQSGLAFHHATAIFSAPDVAFSGPEGRGRDFVDVLLHESYHAWCADLVLVRDGPHPHWFVEGFAQFFSRRMRLRGGWIDLDGYVDDLNQVLRRYATSPARGATAARVEEEFASDAYVRWQPYRLGDLIAARVDAAMLAHSDGERGVEDFMRALVAESRAAPRGRITLTLEELFVRLEEASGVRLDDVRRSVLEGAPFELPDGTFEPVLRLGQEELASGAGIQVAIPVEGWREAARARL